MVRQNAMFGLGEEAAVPASCLAVSSGGSVAGRARNGPYYDTEILVPVGLGGKATTVYYFNSTTTTTDGDSFGPNTKDGSYTNALQSGQLPAGNYLRVFGMQLYLSYRTGFGQTAQQLDDKRKIWDTSFLQFNFGSTPYLQIPAFRVPSGTGVQGPVSTAQVSTTVLDVQMGVPVCSCYYDLTVPAKICRDVVTDGTVEVDVPDFQSPTPGTRKVCIDVPTNGNLTKDQYDQAVAAAYAKTPAERAAVVKTVKKAVKNCARQCNISVPRMPIEFSETENFSVSQSWPIRPTFANTIYMTLGLVSIWIKPLSA